MQATGLRSQCCGVFYLRVMLGEDMEEVVVFHADCSIFNRDCLWVLVAAEFVSSWAEIPGW